MARYDWPGSPPRTSEDNLGLRDQYRDRLWCHIADRLLEDASDAFRDLLATLAENGMTEAQADLQRWLPLGPSTILRGQASNSPRVAGRIRDIKRSPDGSRLYAASANGGVWFSGDSGQSWSPLGGMATTPDVNARGRSANSLVVGCLHVHFGADADTDVIHAGTGEPQGNSPSGGIPGRKNGGIGILRLTRTVSAALGDPTGNPWEREAPNLIGAGIYRLEQNPANEAELVAATTFGLFKRSGGFTRDRDWTRVIAAPFNFQNNSNIVITDLAWVPAATAPAAAPARLFVALVNRGGSDPESAVYVSEAGADGPYEKIALPGYAADSRIALAAVMPLQASPSAHPQIAYVLSSAGRNQPRLWRLDGKAAHKVSRLPPPLFGGSRLVGTVTTRTSDQSWYDMAIAVDPANPMSVIVGGSTEKFGGAWSASLYRLTLTGTAAADDFRTDFNLANIQSPSADPTYIGGRVHADVHCVRLDEAGTQVWIGCDGGVFTSSASGSAASFQARNNGLAVTECGFVASHPSHPGPLCCGTQDNGAIRRIGDTIWEMQFGGDGGGVVFHPQPGREAFNVAQYIKTDWNGNGHFDPPVERKSLNSDDIAKESGRASFYSAAAAAPGASAGAARIALGSYRLWLSSNWDPLAASGTKMAWRTLPSASDPLGEQRPDFSRDELDSSVGSVISIKWLDPGTPSGPAFFNSKLLVLYQNAIARVFQKPGTVAWDREILAWTKKKRITENSDIPANGAPSEKLPMLGAWSEIAVHEAARAGDPAFKGSFYVSATGSSIITAAGVTEFDRMDTLWWFDGKKDFYPTGLRANGTKAPAFCVICDPQNRSIVYAGTAMGVWKGVIDLTGPRPDWQWVMNAIGLPEAVVHDLSIFWNPANPGLKLLRAATQSRGVWELDISAAPKSVGKTYLRLHPLDTRQVTPVSLVNLQDTTAAPAPYPLCFSPDITVSASPPPVWIIASPSEADLEDHRTGTVKEEIGTAPNLITSQPVNADQLNAYVLVHHRHTKPVPANQIKVALIKRRMTEADGDGRGLNLSAAWKTAIVNLVANGQNATLDDTWKRADAAEDANPAANPVTAANTVRNPERAIDARTPSAAEFTLDLTGAAAGQRYLLLALVSSSKDPMTAAELAHANVGELLLNCRHAAARIVHI